MRNLKRVLSLVMAVAMLVGLMVVSASAVGTYEDFTDKDEIKNTEAVQTMVSLGVINGKEDGSYFDPDGTVTRAEMAKLIAVCLNGGKDPLLGTGAVTTNFSDVSSSYWAAPYIAYCANLGIINGRGDGTFGPEEPVTGTAAAKMMLTALGYRSDIEGLTGAGWDLNSDTLANKVGLYNGMNIVPSNGLSRDNTAQLIYNGVQAEEVVYRNNYGEYSGVIYAQPVNGTGNNAESSTMLWVRFKVQKVEGVVAANDVFAIDGGAKSQDGKARLQETEVYGYNSGNTGSADGTYTVEISNDYVGRRVVLYVQYKDYLSPNAVNSVVVGLPILSDKNTVATTSAKLKDTDAVKSFASSNNLSFTTATTATNMYGVYTVDKDGSGLNTTTAGTPSVTTVDNPTLAACVTSDPGKEQIFIDHNGDSVVDYVIQVTDQMAKLSVYDEKNEKLTIAGAGSIDFADVVGYENVAKDDIVLYHKLNETYYVYPAESVSGTVTAYNADDKTVSLDGTSYKASLVGLTAAGTDLTTFSAGETLVGDGYTLYMDRFGNVVAKAVYEETVGNYALVLDSAVLSGIGNQGEVKLLLADGTTATYRVNLVGTYNRLNGVAGISTGLTTSLAKERAVLTALTKSGSTSPLMYNIVTYTVNSANEVTLSDPAVGDYAAVQKTPATGDQLAGRLHNSYTMGGNTIVPNNSTIYFFYDKTTGTADVTVGLNSLRDEISSTIVSGAVYYNNSNAIGRYTARALYVDGLYQGAKNYVYISGDYTMTLDSETGEKVYTYPVVNTDGTTGTIKSRYTTAGSATITDGYVYEYTLDSDGYADLALTDPDTNVAGEVNGFVTTYVDGKMTVTRVAKGIYGSETAVYSIADDANIYNVEDTDNVREETLTDGMAIAFTVDADGYIDNIFVTDVNVEFRTVTIGANPVLIPAVNPNDSNVTVSSGTIQVANGFTVRVPGVTSLTYTVTNDNGTVTTPTVRDNAGNGYVEFTVPENCDVTLP